MSAEQVRKRPRRPPKEPVGGGAAEAPAPRAPEPQVRRARELVEDLPLPAPDPLDEFFYRPDEGAAELEEFSVDAELAPEPEEAPREYLAFALGDELYALELARIREVVKVPPITEVPRTAPEVAGVMSLRGEVMPVFEVRRRLGLPPPPQPLPRQARVVVVDLGEAPAGLLVDRVEQVVRLRPSTIEPPPQALRGGVENEFLSGIGRSRERMIALLNLPAVLARALRRELP